MDAYMYVSIHVSICIYFLLKQKTFNKVKCNSLTSVDISSQSEVEMPTFSLRAGGAPLLLHLVKVSQL